MIFEGLKIGISPLEIEEYTWGEVLECVNAHNERKRQEYQILSMIAYRHADLVSSWVFDKKDVELTEAFPFWTDEESEEIKKENMLRKYKNIMQKHASTKVTEG